MINKIATCVMVALMALCASVDAQEKSKGFAELRAAIKKTQEIETEMVKAGDEFKATRAKIAEQQKAARLNGDDHKAKSEAFHKAYEAAQKELTPETKAALQQAMLENVRSKKEITVIAIKELDNATKAMGAFADKAIELSEQLATISEITSKLAENDELSADEVKKMAARVENLVDVSLAISAAGYNDKEMAAARRTLKLQYQTMKKMKNSTLSLGKQIDAQRKVMEETVAQLAIIQRRMEFQKHQLAQVSLMQVLNNTLIKAQLFMAADVRINKLPAMFDEIADNVDKTIDDLVADVERTSENGAAEDADEEDEDWIEQVRKDAR